jgi:hypothetical protein
MPTLPLRNTGERSDQILEHLPAEDVRRHSRSAEKDFQAFDELAERSKKAALEIFLNPAYKNHPIIKFFANDELNSEGRRRVDELTKVLSIDKKKLYDKYPSLFAGQPGPAIYSLLRVTKGFRIVWCVSQITALAAMMVAAQAAKTPIL